MYNDSRIVNYLPLGGIYGMYKIRTDVIADEFGKEYVFYGFDVIEPGKPTKTFESIFSDYNDADNFVNLINHEIVDPSQIKYVVDDVLCAMHSV